MHTKSNNIEIVVGSETDEIIKDFLKSRLHRYQEGLEESMKGSEFVFDSVNSLHYHLQKTSLKRIRSLYTDSLEWLKNKKITMNPSVCLNRCIKLSKHYKNPQRISNIKPFINKYDWKGINFPSHKEDWKKIETNNKSIAFNILYKIHLQK